MQSALLEVRGVKKHYPISGSAVWRRKIGYVKAVDGIDFSVFEGDAFGIVGESGCGKTTTLKLILLREPLTSGKITFGGLDISNLSKGALRQYRSSVQAMFQDPQSSLNPRLRVRDIISEPIKANLPLTRVEVEERVQEALLEVKLPPDCARFYPHEFSGGQRQRIALARAMAIRPKLVILDEPVSALDVSVRAQLMNLLVDLQQELRLTYIVVAHDLAVVRHMCNRIAVMYLGRIVEYGDTEAIYDRPLHPYTRALMSAALPFHPDEADDEIIIEGEVPNPINPPTGCHFHPRCPWARRVCRDIEPVLVTAEPAHQVSCLCWEEIDR